MVICPSGSNFKTSHILVIALFVHCYQDIKLLVITTLHCYQKRDGFFLTPQLWLTELPTTVNKSCMTWKQKQPHGTETDRNVSHFSTPVYHAAAIIAFVAMSTGIKSAVAWKFPCMHRNNPLPIWNHIAASLVIEGSAVQKMLSGQTLIQIFNINSPA